MMNTNQILKMVIKKINKHDKRSFVKFLKVNIEDAFPIDFTNCTYSKTLHEQDLFLFLNDEFRILGILKGSVYDKYTRQFEVSHYNLESSYPRNRKHLTEHATIILQIPSKMRTYQIKSKPTEYGNAAYRDLKLRLERYKRNKYSSIEHSDILNKSEEIFKILTRALVFDNTTVISKLTTYIDTADNYVRSFTNLFRDYKYQFEQYDKRITNGVEEYFLVSYRESMNDKKAEIMQWYKKLVG